MSDRKNEIAFAMDLIQKICEETHIGIIAKEVKGNLMIVIQDAWNGEEYCMTRK